MPTKSGDGYVSTVRGLDIGMELLKQVEKIGARETSIPRSTVDEFDNIEETEPEWKDNDWTAEQWANWQHESNPKMPEAGEAKAQASSFSNDWSVYPTTAKPPKEENTRGGWSGKGNSQAGGERSASRSGKDGGKKEKERGVQKESVHSAEQRIRQGASENCYKAQNNERVQESSGEGQDPAQKEKEVGVPVWAPSGADTLVKEVWEQNKKTKVGSGTKEELMKEVMRKFSELEADEKFDKDLRQALRESTQEPQDKGKSSGKKGDAYLAKGEKGKGKDKGVPSKKTSPSVGKTFTTEAGQSSCSMLNYMMAQAQDTGGEIYGKWMSNVEHLKTPEHRTDLMELLMRKFTENAVDYQYGSQMTLAVLEFASAMRAWSNIPYLSYYSITELIGEQASFSIQASNTGKSLMISMVQESTLYGEFCEAVAYFLRQGRKVRNVPMKEMKAVWAQHEMRPFAPYKIAYENGNQWCIMTTMVGEDPIEYPTTEVLQERGLLPAEEVESDFLSAEEADSEKESVTGVKRDYQLEEKISVIAVKVYRASSLEKMRVDLKQSKPYVFTFEGQRKEANAIEQLVLDPKQDFLWLKIKYLGSRWKAACFGEKYTKEGSSITNPIRDDAMVIMWKFTMRFRALQLNQLPLAVRVTTHEIIKEFLQVLLGARKEEATMWWTIKNCGIDTNSGENRALLIRPGRGMNELKTYGAAEAFIKNYAADLPELHIGKEIIRWFGATNVFVAKMGFLPIGVEFDVQLSILISEPEPGRRKGCRLEVVDARMMRMIHDSVESKELFRTFREYQPRYAEAERKVNEGEELVHHCPIRRLKAEFNYSIEKHGMNTRVTVKDGEWSWISHNVLGEPGQRREENVLRVGAYNWWWNVNQLTGFNTEELRIIEKKKLLGTYAKEKTMQSCWETLPFQYE